MQITFVNHASLIIKTEDVTLLCDPWNDGLAFNNGWALISPTAPETQQYEQITHIWFSHEHPDHFSPSTLKSIPDRLRQGITVLFQVTEDKRVAKFCTKLGFKSVIEIHPNEWLNLAPETRILCNPQIDEWQSDSWLCLKSTDKCILNVNDCGVYTEESARRIAELTGPVDMLCTQFSYAAWQGNANDIDGRKRQAARTLQHIRTQVKVLEPRYVLPFASFVWFCHEENLFLNEGMNNVATAAEWIEKETSAEAVVLYSGDSWKLGAPHDWRPAAAKYLQDMESILSSPKLEKSEAIAESKLQTNAEQFINRYCSSSSKILIQLYLAMESFRGRRETRLRSRLRDLMDLVLFRIEPARIFVTDLEQAYQFSIPNGLSRVAVDEGDCDISMSAESLDHCFVIDWGGETLLINGRFQEPQSDDKPKLSRGDQAKRWFKFTDLSRRLNMGFNLDWSVARDAILWRIRELVNLKQTLRSG